MSFWKTWYKNMTYKRPKVIEDQCVAFQKILDDQLEFDNSIRKIHEDLDRSLEEIRWDKMFRAMEESERIKTRERIRNPKSIYLRHKK